ncbi:MBOAT, membrane-bound O-acyltransferase family-domain-containing protein [Schizophyllum amplum]|uniref:MBOAT, membrane-bound O-acyltransferase family-domain-containing protein n=1 Tax=Schizophyllum amplum TaxID=97359 RepID=A0A550CUV4_9AGAR|nr:MBOAT, membrane-bound O-acyltransferase family-domain-containing protein [Auriculariopsis ampla]
MDALFAPLAGLVGASVDQVKLIFCLLVAFPLGSLYIRIPSSNPNARHLFSIAVALFFFIPVLDIPGAFVQLLADMLFTYTMARYNTSPSMPWVVFWVVMGHLTANHVIRAVYNLSYETIEVTGPQMVLVMKLTTFAWNVRDGREKPEDLDKWQLARRVVDYPSLTAFLGYALYFPGVLVGPYLDFSEYNDLVTDALFKGVQVAPGHRRLPSGRKRVAYRRLIKGLVCLGLFVVLGGTYNFSATLEPWFINMSFWQRLVLFQICGFFERCKYYAIWTLTEGASIVTGFGFTGFNEKGKSTWHGAANIRIRRVELAENFKVLLDNWNIKTNIWLKECVYKRVTPKGQKAGFKSGIITSATSAFWHGVRSGYYLTFLLGAFITPLGRLMRTNVRPLLLPAPGAPPSLAKRVYDVSGRLASQVLVNYAAAPFMLLTVSASVHCWNQVAWYGHVLVGGGLVFFYAGGARYCKRLQAKRGSAQAATGTTTPVQAYAVPAALEKVFPPHA